MIAKSKTKKSPVKKVVTDQHGQSYELLEKLGGGGEGDVWTTQFPNVLVKISRANDDARSAWCLKIKSLMRKPLDGLPIAHPLALIVEPKAGYVMKLMDGLIPIVRLIEEGRDALMDDRGLGVYIQTGGLKRRLRILAKLARILADLHGRGMAFGDLSPTNVFISSTVDYTEVWLIDSDNISTQSRSFARGVYTPDFGAPEILMGESGNNTLTDSWSFAVLAFWLLALAHPLKGDAVLDGEPEAEAAAMKGELPWVDHPEDCSNELTSALPREYVLSKKLQALFDQCFNAGMASPGERPSLCEWAEAFEAATGHCDSCASCGSTFFYNAKHHCPFCDHVQEPEQALLMKEYHYLPPDVLRDGLDVDIADTELQKHCWSSTGTAIVLPMSSLELKKLPLGASLFDESTVLGKVDLGKDGLWIEPSDDHAFSLQREHDDKSVRISKKQRLKPEIRTGASYWLHLGDVNQEHLVWRFKW